jgi:acetyl-CoA C-acetyltransferase
MAKRVAIVAAAQTKYEESKQNLSYEELVWEVVEKVTQDAGLMWADRIINGFGIDSIVSCSEDYWDSRVISQFAIQRELGAHGMPETKVCADGTKAVYLATIQILSGRYDVVLVVSHRKESVTVRSIIENCGLDPIYMRPLGLDYTVAAAMQARRYMFKYGISEEQCAKVVVKNRKNGKSNPFAQLHSEVRIEDVLKSKIIAEPIKLLDAKPVSDGACAIILASEEKAKKITDKPIWIKGIGNCYDLHYLGDRDLADCNSLEFAAKQAYSMAGITNPKKEIDVAEIFDEYSYQELLWTEGLGFCDRGKGGELIDRGVTQIGGEIPINPSGGLLSGVPSGVAGMSRVAEGFLQLRNEAAARQVDGVRTALAHGVTGSCGQAHCVIILGN